MKKMKSYCMKYSFKSHKTRVHTVYYEFDTIEINKSDNKMIVKF